MPSRMIRIGGIGLVVSSLLVAPVAWIALSLIAGVAVDPPYPPEEIPAAVRPLLAWRGLAPLLALPSAVCGGMLLRRRPAVGASELTLLVVGTFALLVPLAVVLAAFLAVVAPMYEYREL